MEGTYMELFITFFYNIASIAAQLNEVYVSLLKISIVHADSVSKSLPQKVFFPASVHYCLILLSVFRVRFDAQFHWLCYILLVVHYRVMENLGSLESTQKARVALGYRLVQLLRFFRALQTAHMLHTSIVYTEA